MSAQTITTSEEDGSLELVKRAVRGDVEAYGKLYGIYLDRIYRHVYYRVKNVMMAEDITEEVFIKAWKNIKTCKGKEHTFRPWLYRIAHNHMVDTLRKTRRDLPLEVENYGKTDAAGAKLESMIEWQQVLDVVSTLSEPQKEIILLKFVEGVDNQEIEKITGRRQGAIRALQMRALTTLRKRLNVRVAEDER